MSAEPATRYDIEELAPDIARLRIAFVNTYFVGRPRQADSGTVPWVLVDAALSVGASQILEVAADRFGRDSLPTAIVLTHGHFDHVGALEGLLLTWDVPVYAHHRELAYLTGRADYPAPDPTVGGGLMARMSPMCPERGIDIRKHVKELPSDGEVPGMPGWRWIPTPGHSPGHISLFRVADRSLIAGDAVTTTNQQSVFSVLTQHQEIHGPPAYFTIDWDAAARSAGRLASLKPALLATGHGHPLIGGSVAAELAALASDFESRARPPDGRYIRQPVIIDDDGLVMTVPHTRKQGIRWGMLSGVAAGAVAGTWLVRRFRKKSQQ